MDKAYLGERISELMLDKQIDSSTLATALNVDVSTARSWKRNSTFMNLSQIIKLANYFNCSLDFLVGRSDTVIDFIPQKDYPPFYEQLKKLLKEKGISRNKVNRETRIKSSYFVEWNKGGNPHILSLIELADYLDVTLDFLVGREK